MTAQRGAWAASAHGRGCGGPGDTQTHLSCHIHELGQPQVLAHLTLQEVQEAPCEEDHGHGNPKEQSPSANPPVSLLCSPLLMYSVTI